MAKKIEPIVIGFGRGSDKGLSLAERIRKVIKLSSTSLEDMVDFDNSLKKLDELTTVTNIEINNVEIHPCNHLQKLEKELKSIKRRLKRCGYIESQELREREIEVRKEIKYEKRRISNAI